MALLMQNIQGDIRSHLLLTENIATTNFDNAATKVEDYYRNVYIDNNNPGGIQAREKESLGKAKERQERKGRLLLLVQ
eukprot:2597852-Amphidinium_carterae.1